MRQHCRMTHLTKCGRAIAMAILIFQLQLFLLNISRDSFLCPTPVVSALGQPRPNSSFTLAAAAFPSSLALVPLLPLFFTLLQSWPSPSLSHVLGACPMPTGRVCPVPASLPLQSLHILASSLFQPRHITSTDSQILWLRIPLFVSPGAPPSPSLSPSG